MEAGTRTDPQLAWLALGEAQYFRHPTGNRDSLHAGGAGLDAIQAGERAHPEIAGAIFEQPGDAQRRGPFRRG